MLLILLTGPVVAGNLQEEESTVTIVGATLIDGTETEPVKNAIVVIRGGLIECAGNRQQCLLDPDTQLIDATGKWLVPGFIDSHVHWQIWYDDQKLLSPEKAAAAARVYLANGITTLVDVGGQRWVDEANRQVLDKLQESDQPAPRLFYSGWIDRKVIEASDSKDAGVIASELLIRGNVGIKVHNGLNRQDYERITGVADRLGYPVYGHTYYLDETGFVNRTSEAISAGVDGIFHVLGIPPASNVPPLPAVPMENWQAWWLAGAKLWLHTTDDSMDELIRQMLNKQVWLQPTLITEYTLIQPDHFRDSPNWTYSPATWEELRLGFPVFEGEDLAQYRAAYAKMQLFVKRFFEAGGMLVAGTDGLPIPGFGLQEEMRLLVEAGIPSQVAIRSATHHASNAWQLQDQIGTLQHGKVADLVILDGDPLVDIAQTKNIWRVIKSGNVHDPYDLLK